jgi:hypothetical protein
MDIVVKLLEILGGLLVVAVGGAVVSVAVVRRYALRMTSLRDQEDRPARGRR